MALDNPNSGQGVELFCDRLPVCADPACDFDKGGRRHDARALAVPGAQPRQSQQFGLDAIVDRQGAELINRVRQRSDGPCETR